MDKTIQAYGGKKALLRPMVLVQSGRVASSMRGGSTGAMVRVFQFPSRLRVEIAYPGETAEVRLLEGERCWRDGRLVQGPAYDAVLLQAGRLALPILLAEHPEQVRDLGLSERGGKKARILEVPLRADLSVAAEIDLDSGRILRTTGRGRGGLEFVAEYADFRKVDGLLFPFTETTFAMGQKTSQIVLDKVQLVATPPKGAFEPPAG